MSICTCTVAFTERGIEHQVDVLAETAYEACALAIKAFERKPHLHGPGRHTTLRLQVKQTQHYEIKVDDFLGWLYDSKPAVDEKQRLRKIRLKGILADDRR